MLEITLWDWVMQISDLLDLDVLQNLMMEVHHVVLKYIKTLSQL